jgi:hypothetical protein
VTQQSIDQEIYRQGLIEYVKANSNKNEQQAIAYLDEYCQEWREANPPQAGMVEVSESGEQEQ